MKFYTFQKSILYNSITYEGESSRENIENCTKKTLDCKGFMFEIIILLSRTIIGIGFQLEDKV